MSLRTAFAAHGIDHLSASSLNSYVAEPALWVMERLLKRSAPVGAAAHRGQAIEAGVTVGLLFPEYPLQRCQDVGTEQYESLTALSNDPKKKQEGEAVAPSIAIALRELRAYGIPDLNQHRVEVALDDDLPPLWGFLDFGWTVHNIVLGNATGATGTKVD